MGLYVCFDCRNLDWFLVTIASERDTTLHAIWHEPRLSSSTLFILCCRHVLRSVIDSCNSFWLFVCGLSLFQGCRAVPRHSPRAKSLAELQQRSLDTLSPSLSLANHGECSNTFFRCNLPPSSCRQRGAVALPNEGCNIHQHPRLSHPHNSAHSLAFLTPPTSRACVHVHCCTGCDDAIATAVAAIIAENAAPLERLVLRGGIDIAPQRPGDKLARTGGTFASPFQPSTTTTHTAQH